MTNRTKIPPEDESAARALIDNYIACEAKHSIAKAAYTEAKKKLLSMFPKEIGDFEMDAGPYKAEVTYPERLVWDSDEVRSLYGDEVPVYIKASYSIGVRELARLPAEERELLEKCVERAPGTPKIDVYT